VIPVSGCRAVRNLKQAAALFINRRGRCYGAPLRSLPFSKTAEHGQAPQMALRQDAGYAFLSLIGSIKSTACARAVDPEKTMMFVYSSRS
jgi:hypothetical protein